MKPPWVIIIRILIPQKWLCWGPTHPCYTGRKLNSTRSAVTSPSTSSGLTRPLPRTQEPLVLAKSLLRVDQRMQQHRICSRFHEGVSGLKLIDVGQRLNWPIKKYEMFVKVVAYPNAFHLSPNRLPLVKKLTPSRPSQIFGSPFCNSNRCPNRKASPGSLPWIMANFQPPFQPPQRSASQDPKTNRKKPLENGGWETFSLPFWETQKGKSVKCYVSFREGIPWALFAQQL